MTDWIKALERLARLKAEGVLTEEEFVVQKATILGTTAAPVDAPPAKLTTYHERWAEGREQSRGVRHFFRWFWGIQLVAIVLTGINFLTRGSTLEEARQSAAKTAAARDPQAADAAAAPDNATIEAVPHFTAEATITDHTLANPWSYDGDTADHDNSQDVCPRGEVTFVNRSAVPLQLDISAIDTAAVVATLPPLQPGMTARYRTGQIGGYVVSRLDSENGAGASLYFLNVVNCPPR